MMPNDCAMHELEFGDMFWCHYLKVKRNSMPGKRHKFPKTYAFDTNNEATRRRQCRDKHDLNPFKVRPHI